jgi:predicted SAM-dependent methyltransferase
MLLGLIRDIFFARKFEVAAEISNSSRRVLNVGGGSKATPIPKHYDGWQHDLLDIDPRGMPDIVSDARELTKLDGGVYDAIYCSHNLEHYYRHDGVKVIRGFLHMLNETGFAEIRVPDIAWVISELRERQLELDDILYQSPAGPIPAHDVIYGLQSEIMNSGQDFYAHKTGFTPKSLVKMLAECGFQKIFLINDEQFAVHAFAFKTVPTAEQHVHLGTSLSLASVDQALT